MLRLRGWPHASYRSPQAGTPHPNRDASVNTETYEVARPAVSSPEDVARTHNSRHRLALRGYSGYSNRVLPGIQVRAGKPSFQASHV